MKKVLIVDDYEDIHEILTFVLQDEQITVKCLASASQLKATLQEWQPNLLMLDVRLGEVDGRSICDELKADPLYQDLKITLMSAMAEGWRDQPCQADAKIDKPFEIDEVRVLILDLLGLDTDVERIALKNY